MQWQLPHLTNDCTVWPWSISDTLLDENDEPLVFVSVWDCRTHDVDDVIGRVDQFGFQNFYSPALKLSGIYKDITIVYLQHLYKIYTQNLHF